MLEQVLVPLDTSENAEAVLPDVALIAKALEQPVILLSVLPGFEIIDSPEYQPAMANVIERRMHYAQEYLREIATNLEAAGIATHVVVETGPIAERIMAVASQRGAGLIAITSHAAGAQPWFLGGIADSIIRHAQVPVLVSPAAAEGRPPTAINQILVPLDGSSVAERALAYAAFLANTLHVPMMLLRAAPPNLMITARHPYGVDASLPGEVLAMLRASAEAYLQRVVAPLRARGLEG